MEASTVRAHEISACRLCGGGVGRAVLSLGDQPISNRLPKAGRDADAMPAYPLDIVLCERCGLPQLLHNLDASAHFHDDYTYVSGASSTWVAHCADYAARLIDAHGVGTGDLVVEAGSNDGTLLKAFSARGVKVLGVEPSGNVAEMARQQGVASLTAFFNPETAATIRAQHGAPKAFIGNNVLAHVPDTHAFLSAARDLIADDGFLCFEFPHFTHILDRRYFDTIYHEHYIYLGVGPLLHWAANNGMAISAVEPQTTHGGSLRVFLRRADSHAGASSREPPESVAAFLRQEQELAGAGPWHILSEWLDDWRREFVEMIDRFKSEGKTIAGYAAASKATVICNFLGLTHARVDYCCDASPLKQGRIIPGTGIPILAPEQLRSQPPDVVLVFAWNIFDEIARVVSGLVERPVSIVRPLPEIELVPTAPRGTT